MTKTVQKTLCILSVGFLMTAFASCSHLRHGEKKQRGGSAATATPQVIEAASARPTVADREADLRELVRGQIAASARMADEQKSKVIRSKPYYYKQWDVYPEGPEAFTVLTQEKESRSVPYVADVTVAKQHFGTRLHRERAEAERDTNFLRDTGTETITYEFRNGHWVRTGSLFIADTSEENVNGEWVQVDETSVRTVAAEEDRSEGWLSRTWSAISGRPVHKNKTEKEKEPTAAKPQSRGFQFGGQPRNR